MENVNNTTFDFTILKESFEESFKLDWEDLPRRQGGGREGEGEGGRGGVLEEHRCYLSKMFSKDLIKGPADFYHIKDVSGRDRFKDR